MKRIIALSLFLCLLLCGCGQNAIYETVAPTATPTDGTLTTEPAATTYTHPLTGEALDAPLTARPIAVVINNIAAAQPLWGISQADFLYETLAEGGVTRMLAIFTNAGEVEKIGSIRSARTYFIDIAKSYNAPLYHCGGSTYALNELKTNDLDHIDQRFNGKYFYRDAERRKAGYATEHTLFATGQGLLDALTDKKMETTVAQGTDYKLHFAQNVDLQGESAAEISYTFTKNGKGTSWTYNASTGCYNGLQKWSGKKCTIADEGNNKKDVDFKNVMVLFAKQTSDGYRTFDELTGTNKGYFATNGKIVPITWKRTGEKDNFEYFLSDGTPLTLSVGKTYVAVLSENMTVSYK